MIFDCIIILLFVLFVLFVIFVLLYYYFFVGALHRRPLGKHSLVNLIIDHNFLEPQSLQMRLRFRYLCFFACKIMISLHTSTIYCTSNSNIVVCREAFSPCQRDTSLSSPSSNPLTVLQGVQSLMLCIQESPQRRPEEKGALSPTKRPANVDSEVCVCAFGIWQMFV